MREEKKTVSQKIAKQLGKCSRRHRTRNRRADRQLIEMCVYNLSSYVEQIYTNASAHSTHAILVLCSVRTFIKVHGTNCTSHGDTQTFMHSFDRKMNLLSYSAKSINHLRNEDRSINTQRLSMQLMMY